MIRFSTKKETRIICIGMALAVFVFFAGTGSLHAESAIKIDNLIKRIEKLFLKNKRPVRVAIFAKHNGKDKSEVIILSSFEERLHDIPSIDIVLAEAAHYAGSPPLTYSSKAERLVGFATKNRADYLLFAQIDQDNIVVNIADSHGKLFSHETFQFSTIAGFADRSDESDRTQAGFDLAATGKSPKGGGFLSRPWDKKIKESLEGDRHVLGLRDNTRFARHEEKGKVLSVSELASGAKEGTPKQLALLFENHVKIVNMPGDKFKTVAEIKIDGSLMPVSLVSFDLDEDGQNELIVNAVKGFSFASLILKKNGRIFTIIKKDLSYYFSIDAGGELLAQGGKSSDPVSERYIFGVSSYNGKLNYTPALKLEGKEIPVGIDRVDIDNDGIREIVGISPLGHLLIFSGSGSLAWKSARFGFTEKILKDTSLSLPAKVIPIKKKNGGALIAAGGAMFKKGGIFSSDSLVKGFVRYLEIDPKGYKVRDKMQGAEGWISDLFRVTDSKGKKIDAAGFIRVISDYLGYTSIITMPH